MATIRSAWILSPPSNQSSLLPSKTETKKKTKAAPNAIGTNNLRPLLLCCSPLESRERAGLILIGAVVIIWVSSAEITQEIFTDYKQPFAITYLGASLMIIYLPIAFIKDWLHRSWKMYSKGNKNAEADNQAPFLCSPTKYKEMQKIFQVESQTLLTRKDGDVELAAQEKAEPLTAKFEDDVTLLQQNKGLSTREIAAHGFLLAPIWFATEYFLNAALARTIVASTMVLSSTSGPFTLFISVFMGQDSLNVAKVAAVFISMAGVVMTTMGKTWAADGSQLNSSGNGKQVLIGDLCGVLGAISYGLFTCFLLKNFSGEEGERIDVQKLFGNMGLITLVAMWWLGKAFAYCCVAIDRIGGLTQVHHPDSARMEEILLANGFLGSALSDYCWALCVVWTNQLVATLGMSLTIPIAMVADLLIHSRHYSAVYVPGSVQVSAGFVIVNLWDKISQLLQL